MSEDSDFVCIDRGRGKVILCAGYQYYKNKNYANGSFLWKCSKYRKLKCPGSISITNNRIIKNISHGLECLPDFAQNELDLKLYECKQEVINLNEPVPSIYKKTRKSLKDKGLDIICKIPRFQNIKTSLYDNRNKAAGLSKMCCTDLQDALVPPKYDNFLLADYWDSSTRILVFCSETIRTEINSIDHFLSDGTFKSCPPPFKQLYTIHGDIGSTENETNIVPLIYAFMSDSTKKSYVILIQLLKSQFPQWQPKKYTVDFKEAAMGAIVSEFPEVKLKGCYYHYRKNVWKHAKKQNLVTNKKTNRMVSLSSVLPLLSNDNIRDGWTYIKDIHVRDGSKEENFVKYMETYWLKNDNFIDVWCVFGERHRTTNYLEGWHYNINKSCKNKTINLMNILKILNDDSILNEMKIIRVPNCIPDKNRENEQIMKDQYIQDCQMRHVSGEISVGHFLEMMR